MGGFSDKELYGELTPGGRKSDTAGEPGPKKGKVLRIHGPDVFIDIPGGRSQGVLPMVQFPEGPPEIGTEVEVHIEGYDPANGLLILSRKGAAVHVDWSSVAEGMVVEARVTETNKGGLAVDVNGIRGFMPISQIDLYRVENAEQFVNQRLLLPGHRGQPGGAQPGRQPPRLAGEGARGSRGEALARAGRGPGPRGHRPHGQGLRRLRRPRRRRRPAARQRDELGARRQRRQRGPAGPALKVVVLKIDREHRKLSLGLKQLEASPWDNIQTSIAIGGVVPGKVTRLMDFGAFVELEPGVEGLIHISELAPQRVRRVADIVQAGQEVQVKVLNIDTTQRRIGLSLKAPLPKKSRKKRRPRRRRRARFGPAISRSAAASATRHNEPRWAACGLALAGGREVQANRRRALSRKRPTTETRFMPLPRILADTPLAPLILDMMAPHVEVVPWSAADASIQAIYTYGHPPVDAALLDRLPGVRVISNFGVGVDHIDVPAAAATAASRSATRPASSTAPPPTWPSPCCWRPAGAWSKATATPAARNFLRYDPVYMLGREVHGSTLGIVGLGRIGEQVAKRARGFDMTVLYHNRRRLDPKRGAGPGRPLRPLRRAARPVRLRRADGAADRRTPRA